MREVTLKFEQLLSSKDRSSTASEIANLFHAEHLLLFIRDRRLGQFLPAPGFPQALKDGLLWHRFVDESRRAGVTESELTSPFSNKPVRVVGIGNGDLGVAVLLGEGTSIPDLTAVIPLFSLTFHALTNEYECSLLTQDLKNVESSVLSTKLLVEKVDAARRETSIALSQVRESKRRLEATNRELEQFSMVASHDLKQPLRTISSFMGLLKLRLEPHLTEQTRQYVFYCSDAAKRMSLLIDQLMLYSRLGQGERGVGPVDTAAAVDTVVADLGAAIAETGAKVEWKTLPVVEGNLPEIIQLFQNLIANSIKYRGSDAPRVEIESVLKGSHWLFCVKDNGIGIPPQYQTTIFEPFKRIHGPSEKEGSGLGLALCKKIVALHNGEIWVESTPGKGSTFFFTLQGTTHVAGSAD